MTRHERVASDGDKNLDFSKEAERPPIGFWREFAEFLSQTKKWWLIPLLLALALLTLVAMLSGSPLAPFIYPIF